MTSIETQPGPAFGRSTVILGHPPPRYKRPFPFPKAQRISVLVVEDDEEISAALVSLLEAEGFVAVRARDGRQALNVLSDMAVHPGLILLDLMMPTMNGWQFRDEQLKDARLRSIPVVVLSAFDGTVAESGDMSFDAVLRKPITVDALVETVRQHFQRFN